MITDPREDGGFTKVFLNDGTYLLLPLADHADFIRALDCAKVAVNPGGVPRRTDLVRWEGLNLCGSPLWLEFQLVCAVMAVDAEQVAADRHQREREEMGAS